MTGAPHSSVKRYRDLARNPPQKRTRTRAAARRCSSAVRSARFRSCGRERRIPARRARRSARSNSGRTTRRRRRRRVHRFQKNAGVDEPGEDTYGRRRASPAESTQTLEAVTGRFSAAPRRRARCSGSRQRGRHHAHGRSCGSDRIHRIVPARPIRSAGKRFEDRWAARCVFPSLAPDIDDTLRASAFGSHFDDRARAARWSAVVQRRLPQASRARSRRRGAGRSR